MPEAFWLALAVKMVVSAALVVAASLVVERSGPVIGALVATLPVSSGPSYLYLALDHGPDFLAASASVSLFVNAATGPFIVAYARLADRGAPLPLSLGGGLLVWIVGVGLVLNVGTVSLPVALALNALAYAGAFAATRRLRARKVVVRAVRRAWDVPLRAAIVMALVLAVVLTGRLLGPRAAGVATMVPASLLSLVLILQPRIGGPATAAVFAHTLPGMIGFGVGIAVLRFTAVPLGSAAALALALATCLAWNLALLVASRARRGRSEVQATGPATNSAAV